MILFKIIKKWWVLSMSIIFFGCNNQDEHFETKTRKSTVLTFDSIFRALDTINFTATDNIQSIISLTKDSLGNMVICDYIGEKVYKYDFLTKYITKLQDTVNNIKILKAPIASGSDNTGLYISSNKNRRILIYNGTDSLKNHFLIAGSNMTPISILPVDSILFMGGYNLSENNLVHKYSIKGTFKKSFLIQGSEIGKTKLAGTINYPFMTVLNKSLFIVQTSEYKVHKFGLNGNLIKQILFTPDYFIPLSQVQIDKAEKAENPSKIQNEFSRPVCLFTNENKLFIQVEMPKDTLISNSDYSIGANYRLDIFDDQLEPTVCGIDCGNKRLLYVDKKAGTFFFLTKADYKKKLFTIERFGILK